MEHWNEHEWNKVLEELAQRAAKDPEVRELALRDAGAAVQAVTGRHAPAGYAIKCVTNGEQSKTLVLPPFIPEIQELTDVDLEQVAGGDFGVTWRR